jgi:conjugative relaxase-like TrwC/TraI family protein
MVTISKPLSATQAAAYHAEEFTNAEQSYYSQGQQVRGEWQGKLAAEWGLKGAVTEEAFSSLAAGQHPETGEQLIRHTQARELVSGDGTVTKTMEHRAGWDATFSAPKTVSLAALVGGDERVRVAHREAVTTALDEMERYVQARIGGNAPAETTAKWAVAKFEHDTARPVDGYAAPQLHTHAVFFNVTVTESGKEHSVQPQELYRTQQYATAVYQSELASKLREMGYEIEAGKTGAPEIKGFTQEYVEAMSPRRQQIEEHLDAQGKHGAAAAQIAAHRTRDAKEPLSEEETVRRHHEMAAKYGNQPAQIVEATKGRTVEPRGHARPAQSAMTFARDRNMEREAVVDERAMMRDALKRSMGQATFAEVKAHFNERIERGEFVEVAAKIGRNVTTPEMIALERSNIERMKEGQGRYEALAEPRWNDRLSVSQNQAVQQVLESRDQVTGLQGAAGAGKTTSLAALREAVEQAGYTVEGLAPTSRAAYQLEEAGIKATTLQHHLVKSASNGNGAKHLYIVDESSLASSQQIHEFLQRLKENDRVLLVGDTRQHQAVDAGRPFEQLQQAGMRTARLDEIIRQKDEALKSTVEQLARGEVREAVEGMREQGRVHEIADPRERVAAIAQEYARTPEGTLVISPDNASRMSLNRAIHREMQERGVVSGEEHRVTVLVARQEMTGADRAWAARYEVGDVLRYSKGSQPMKIEAGEYARVAEIDGGKNRLTVEREDGEQVTYDPRRLQGVTVYRESERDFAEGDRVQFTAPDKEHRIANRELGTIEEIGTDGQARVKLDSGREVTLDLKEGLHLDYGYAVTSHSSQGATADRVLIHIDSETAGANLLNSRLAYVAVSRARHDAQIFTNDAESLGMKLDRDHSHSAAVEETAAAAAGMGQSQAGAAQVPEEVGQALAMEH